MASPLPPPPIKEKKVNISSNDREKRRKNTDFMKAPNMKNTFFFKELRKKANFVKQLQEVKRVF